MIKATFWSVVVLAHVALAVPPALRDKSWKRLFIALILSFAGITLPVFVFCASAVLVPEWKGACRHGWLDCFHDGKLALLPLVLWASASLYAIDIYRTAKRSQPWIVWGVVTGAIVSTVCFVIGVIIHGIGLDDMRVGLLVPLYVSAWYLFRAWQLLKETGTTLRSIAASLLCSAPFWIGAIIWSRKSYASLPDTAPSCFIATAAMRGHEVVVGTRLRMTHGGEERDANRQLLTLWLLEEVWSSRAPRSHAIFRRVYNAVGPVVASRITGPLLADIAYLAIKPVEIVGRAIVRKGQKKGANQRLEHAARKRVAS